jgi:hypothetical protein
MMDDSPQHSIHISRVFITKETVDDARTTLPPAHLASYDVMEVEVRSSDGSPAMIEFERIRTQDEEQEALWTWEAITCWAG